MKKSLQSMPAFKYKEILSNGQFQSLFSVREVTYVKKYSY